VSPSARRLVALLVALSAAPAAGGCAGAPAPSPAAPGPPVAPTRSDAASGLSPFVVAALRRYPTDGSLGYHWPDPRESAWEGTPDPVVYAGVELTSGDPARRSYCCGLTFAVYVEALLAANGGRPMPDVPPADLPALRLRFFGDSAAGERRRLVEFGLTSLGLGRAVAPDEARPGDFLQLWRRSGSGHSAVFINWVWDGPRRAGLTYWSSQPSTRGIGYRTEWFDGPDGVDLDQLYIARADWPLRAPERRRAGGGSSGAPTGEGS
jgi:hypothetical protein